MKLALCAALLLLPCTALAEGPLTDTVASAIAKRFAAEIKCDAKSKDVQRAWCAVTQIDKSKLVAPKDTTTWLGLSMELPESGEVKSQLLGTTTVSALHLGATSVRLTTLKPSNEQEKQDMLPVLMDLALALKTGGQAVSVKKDLNDFLSSERAKPGYPFAAAGKGVEYQGKLPSRLYQVKNVYVAIESAPKGFFVSVFPAVPLQVK